MSDHPSHHFWSDSVSDLSQRGRRSLTELWNHRPHSTLPHQPIRNLNREFDDRLTLGQRIADAVAATMGSWRFILIQTALLAGWVALNVLAWIHHWDPYPFILLNLMLSFQAAYAAPIIMMSQNRQARKDRLAAEHDFEINLKAEDEIRAILQHLAYQDELILQVLYRLETREDTGSAARGDAEAGS